MRIVAPFSGRKDTGETAPHDGQVLFDKGIGGIVTL